MKYRKFMMWLSILVVIAGTIYGWFKYNPSFGAHPKGERLKRMEQSSNYKDGKFQNPVETRMQTDDMPILKLMKEFFFVKGDRVPEKAIPSHNFEASADSDNQSARITWLGHSTILIEKAGKVILVDPVFSKRTSPIFFLGSKAFPYTHNYSLKDLPEIDLVLISHDHYDHLDYRTILALKEKATTFVMPLGVGAHLERWGISSDRIVELDWWGRFDFSEEISMTAAPARHFSGRRTNNRMSTLWASWIFECGDERIFFGADSGYFPGFKTIGEQFGPFDLVMLECGQYSKYWPFIHMAPEETWKAAVDLDAKAMMPIHWGKYKLSIHPWKEPVERLVEAADTSVLMVTPEIGQSFRLTESLPQSNWWQELN